MEKGLKDFFLQIFGSQVHPVTGAAFMGLSLALVISTGIAAQAATDEIANSRQAGLAQMVNVRHHPKVLGDFIQNSQEDSNLMQDEDCEPSLDGNGQVCVSYQILKFNQRKQKWSAQISYQLEGVTTGSVTFNDKNFVSRVSRSGRRNTGYTLAPEDNILVAFYSQPNGQGDPLASVVMVLPPAPQPGDSTTTAWGMMLKPQGQDGQQDREGAHLPQGFAVPPNAMSQIMWGKSNDNQPATGTPLPPPPPSDR